MAAKELLDRGWGKPDKTHHHDGDLRQYLISDHPLDDDEWTAKYYLGSKSGPDDK